MPTLGLEATEDAKEPAWRSRLRDYIAQQARPAYKFGHQPRLYALTRTLGAGLMYDDDVVFAAVWLHDLGVFIGHRPEEPERLVSWDHVAYATQKAPEILAGFGFPTTKIAAVLDVIWQHQPKDQPASLEATLVRDADILEQLGAIGILRTAAKVASDTRFVAFSDARESLRRTLAALPEQLQLPTARALAASRIETVRSFLESLDAESMPELY